MRSVLLLACGCLSLAAQQQASIEGTAINAVTREPLSEVHIRLVSLTLNGIQAGYGAMSDRAGHFSIAMIRPGTYIPVPERSGFLFVHNRSSESAVPNLSLKPGEHRTDWVVEMTPRAILSGRVLDENGDPVQGAQVRAVDVSPDSGPQVIPPVPNLGSDDRGEFRIVGAPGKFYLQADVGRQTSDRQEVRADGSSVGDYGTTFYPSATARNRASVVEAIAGKEVGGLDIRLQRQRTGGGIHGTVSGLPDRSMASVVMQFGEDPIKITGSRSTTTSPDGKFSLPGGQPGYYRFYAMAGAGTDFLVSRAVEVQFESGDMPPVDLVLAPAMELTGTLGFEGDPPGKPVEKYPVRLEPVGPGGGFGRGSSGETDRDGAFHLNRIWPEKYRVRVDSLPENAYVKSLEIDGSVLKGDVVDFSASRPSSLKVTVSRNGAQLTGKVRDEDGQPLVTAGLAMVLMVQSPEDLRDLGQDGTKQIGPDGKYTFKGLRPGKYRLLAVNLLNAAGADTVATLRKMVERGEEIEIQEGDRLTKDLRLLAKEDHDAK